MGKTILLIGAFDTKGEEYAFIQRIILSRGHDTLALHIGVFDADPSMHVDVSNADVARAGGTPIGELQDRKDRGEAMKVMSDGAAKVVRQLYEDDRFDGAIGMGGTGGTSVITSGMQSLPIGVPKVMVSTAASGDTSAYVGTRDIAMFPSVVDVAGRIYFRSRWQPHQYRNSRQGITHQERHAARLGTLLGENRVSILWPLSGRQGTD